MRRLSILTIAVLLLSGCSLFDSPERRYEVAEAEFEAAYPDTTLRLDPYYEGTVPKMAARLEMDRALTDSDVAMIDYALGLAWSQDDISPNPDLTFMIISSDYDGLPVADALAELGFVGADSRSAVLSAEAMNARYGDWPAEVPAAP